MCARHRPRWLVSAALLVLLLLPAPARAEGDSERGVQGALAKAFDCVVLRPVGLGAALVGTGLFPVAALLSAPGGRDAIEEAWERFVLVPGRNVFTRPLGSF